MPNQTNIQRPITLIGLGRSGTSAMTEILSYHPDIDNIGEGSPMVWDIYESVRLASLNMRYPTSLHKDITRKSLPEKAVCDLFLSSFYSDKPAWVVKLIGPIGRMTDLFDSRESDEAFVDWYFGTLNACFPQAHILTIVRDPIEYARSARRYWGTSFKNVIRDLQFMSVLLRSGRLEDSNILSFSEFRRAPQATINSIIDQCGLASLDFPEAAFSTQYAANQGKAVGGEAQDLAYVSPFTFEEEVLITRAIGPEYERFLTKDTLAISSNEINSTVEMESSNFDYKKSYLSLIDEFNFLKAQTGGLERLVNEKEDLIQKYSQWTKVLEKKIEDNSVERQENPGLGNILGESGNTMDLKIDYPPDFEFRYGYGKPNAKHIEAIINRGEKGQLSFLKKIRGFRKHFDRIKIHSNGNDDDPYWFNGWFPPLDGASLYTIIATRRPQHFIEIGSGNSTKFAKRAIRDHKLSTKIISIDPQPRAEIDALSHEVHRYPLEKIDLSVFDCVKSGDVVFFDGSHRVFQNSDVAVFFMDIMPLLPKGVIVGIHDIFWPFDYPEPWKERYYSEQYMLGAYMIGRGKDFKAILPSAFFTRIYQEEVQSIFSDPVVDFYRERNGYIGGSAFWFEV